MQGKINRNVILTVILGAFLLVMLNIISSALKYSEQLRSIANMFIIFVVGAFWVMLVVVKNKKDYDNEKTTTKARMKLIAFDEIYAKLFAEHRDYLEKKRHGARDKRIIANVFLAIIISCLIATFSFLAAGVIISISDVLLLITIAGGGFILLKATEKERIEDYRAAYKVRIISSLLKNINSDLEYTYAGDEEALWNEFNIAEFGLLPPTTVDYTDKIYGNIEGKHVEMLELNLSNEMTNEAGKVYKEEIFNGMFSKIDLNLNNNFIFKVCNVGVSTRCGAIEPKCKTMQLDSTKFMDNYIVETNDRMLAMRILTSDIMELFINYKLKYGVEFDFVIRGGKMYFLFYSGNMFEPDIYIDSMKKELLLKDYSMIKMIIELIQKILRNMKEIQM